MVKPEAALGAGSVYSGEVRVLPQTNQPTLEPLPPGTLDRAYATQAESVLSKEDIAPHQKDFVRRYFTGLTDREPAAEPPPDARAPARALPGGQN